MVGHPETGCFGNNRTSSHTSRGVLMVGEEAISGQRPYNDSSSQCGGGGLQMEPPLRISKTS